MSLWMRSITQPPWRFLLFLYVLYGHVSGNNSEVAIELSIFASWIATIWGLWTSRKAIKSNFLLLILFIFKLMNFNPPREFVLFVRFDEIPSFVSFVRESNLFWFTRFSWSKKKKKKKGILDKSMYSQILIHFHNQPLLWMRIHCESTSSNHRTELPHELWEQHHCTGRSQPCSLCSTSHYFQFQFLTSHQLPSLSILHESVFRSQNIRPPCPIHCGIVLQTLHWDLGPGFVSMSQARIVRIARLVPLDELKQRNLSELLWLPSFLMIVKQCEDPSANTWLPILQSKFGSAESEPFAHFQRMKPITITTENMNEK